MILEPAIIEGAGAILALSSSAISICGALLNNLFLEHKYAMQIWMVSNILLLAWATGFYFGYWNGGLSGFFLMVMYFVFAISNAYGLARYRNV